MMVKRFAVMFLAFMLIMGAFMFMPEVSGEESDAINPYVVKGASGYISAAVVMFSGNTVLTYDRIAIMGFDLDAEIGSGMDLSMVNLTFGFDSGPAATSPVDVYAIDPSLELDGPASPSPMSTSTLRPLTMGMSSSFGNRALMSWERGSVRPGRTNMMTMAPSTLALLDGRS